MRFASASTTQNVGCPYIMTPSKVGKTKKCHPLFSNCSPLNIHPTGQASQPLQIQQPTQPIPQPNSQPAATGETHNCSVKKILVIKII